MKCLKISIFLLFCSACISTSAQKSAYSEDVTENENQQVVTQDKLFTEQFRLDPESYIDDIPFNTAVIVAGLQQESSSDLCSLFPLPAEKEVDDIPFDTREIFCKSMAGRRAEFLSVINNSCLELYIHMLFAKMRTDSMLLASW